MMALQIHLFSCLKRYIDLYISQEYHFLLPCISTDDLLLYASSLSLSRVIFYHNWEH